MPGRKTVPGPANRQNSASQPNNGVPSEVLPVCRPGTPPSPDIRFPAPLNMKIAKPMLSVMTPIGVVWGLLEAWRFHWWLAVLMGLLLTVIGLFSWMTVRRIRAERNASAQANTSPR